MTSKLEQLRELDRSSELLDFLTALAPLAPKLLDLWEAAAPLLIGDRDVMSGREMIIRDALEALER